MVMTRRLLPSAALAALLAAVVVSAGQAALSPQKTAWRRFSMWTVAIAVYKEEHRTYVGMTRSKLAKWDYGILGYPVRIGWATRTRYCLETTVAGHVFHRVAPNGAITAATSPQIAAPA